MNKIFITLSALVLSVLPFSSCRDFDEVNRDPLAAHRDQVLSEYLINRAMMTAQQDPHIAERAFVRYWKNASHQQREGSLSLGGVDSSPSIRPSLSPRRRSARAQPRPTSPPCWLWLGYGEPICSRRSVTYSG